MVKAASSSKSLVLTTWEQICSYEWFLQEVQELEVVFSKQLFNFLRDNFLRFNPHATSEGLTLSCDGGIGG